MEMAEIAGCKLIVAIVAVSSETSTGEQTKEHGVVHSCRDCRDKIREMIAKGILRGDSIICNVNDSKIREQELAEEMKIAVRLKKLCEKGELSEGESTDEGILERFRMENFARRSETFGELIKLYKDERNLFIEERTIDEFLALYKDTDV